MPFIASIALVSAIAGTATSAFGISQQAKASKEVAKQTQEAERIRAQQARIEFQKRQRDIIRQSLIGRARVESAGANTGTTDSSGVIGGAGSVGSQTADQLNTLGSNFQLGQQLFGINQNIAAAQSDLATAQGITSFGQTLFNSSQTIGNIFATPKDPNNG